jgi:hypothetical protein
LRRLVLAADQGYIGAMSKLSPIESEFATTEEAEAHDRWVRAQVAEALASNEPLIPHDVVMAEVKAILDSKRNAKRRLAG